MDTAAELHLYAGRLRCTRLGLWVDPCEVVSVCSQVDTAVELHLYAGHLGLWVDPCEVVSVCSQVDTAVELHLYAGRPREALQLLMQRLSDALPGSLTNAAKGASQHTRSSEVC